jgi:hypothetical protein
MRILTLLLRRRRDGLKKLAEGARQWTKMTLRSSACFRAMPLTVLMQ